MKTILATAAALLFTSLAHAGTYTVKVTNTMADELLAPILVTDTANDDKIFTMNYVTKAAEHQVLTGDPAKLAMAIGDGMATVGHGEDGPPGVLLAPGKTVEFELTTDARAVRVFAMVAPTMVPDNYVSGVIDLVGNDGMMMISSDLKRFDIGHSEGTMMDSFVSAGGATVEISKKM